MGVQKDYQRRVGPGYDQSNPGATGLSDVKVAHARYDFAVDGGAVSTITPKKNSTIPAKAIITEVIINPTATLVGTTGNVSFGLSAGGAGVAALLAATARASLTAGSIFQGIPVQSATGANSSMIKMSAAGTITITISTNALTSGAADIFVKYVVAAA